MHASLDSNRLLRRLVLSCLFVATVLSPPAQPRAQDSSASFITDLKIRAESNESSAKQHLVDFLSQADTLAPGYNIALEWARSAASRNDPDAQVILGYLYEYDHGVPRDYTKAAENYERAAWARSRGVPTPS